MFATVRVSDPDTSHEAGKANTNNSEDRRLVLTTHAAHLEGLTDYELADLHGRQQNSLGKRRTELRDAGMIQATPLRRKGHTKSLCIVWTITDFGMVALAANLSLTNASLAEYKAQQALGVTNAICETRTS